MAPTQQPRQLLPAARRLPPRPQPRRTCFYDLPAELRIEIYKLALDSVSIHILPAPPDGGTTTTPTTVKAPHALIRTSHQIRLEVLPLIHNSCPISASITDFDFSGLLAWMSRMPPDQEANLCKNPSLTITLNTTQNSKKDKTSNTSRNSQILKKWLHIRADKHRPQPKWTYTGTAPDGKTASDLKRKVKRATHPGEKREMVEMLRAIGVSVPAAADTTANTGSNSES